MTSDESYVSICRSSSINNYALGRLHSSHRTTRLTTNAISNPSLTITIMVLNLVNDYRLRKHRWKLKGVFKQIYAHKCYDFVFPPPPSFDIDTGTHVGYSLSTSMKSDPHPLSLLSSQRLRVRSADEESRSTWHWRRYLNLWRRFRRLELEAKLMYSSWRAGE